VSARRLYVYYRVAAADEAPIVQAMHALQRQWQTALPGLRCELLRRESESSDAEVTMMEVYSAAAGVPPAWQARIEREARALLATWRCSERHVEVFRPCASS
jgi:hypothetical protein